MKFNALIPELTVQDIYRTKHFYIDILDFKIEYERINDKFIFVSYENSQIMFEQYHENGWNIGELEYPFGRGINFSIKSSNIDALYKKIQGNNIEFYRRMNVERYKSNEAVIEQKEFLIQDPDGYLLRFTQA